MANPLIFTSFPYASQLFGVYQPLLGLRSRSAKERVNLAAQTAVKQVVNALESNALVHASHAASPGPIGPDAQVSHGPPSWFTSEASAHAHQAMIQHRQQHGREPTAGELADIVRTATEHAAAARRPQAAAGAHSKAATPPAHAVHEAVVAGMMQHLAQHAPTVLHGLLRGSLTSPPVLQLLPCTDPLGQFDPATQAGVLSPLGLVQLYRQYFYELDSFLGPPVSHVWVSPGGSLELYEVHSRKLTQTSQITQTTNTLQATESASQQESDLADETATNTAQDTNVGVKADAGVNIGVFHAGASTSLDLKNAQQSSHKTASTQKRSQSEKVSSQIQTTFQTTFQTTLEQRDTNSRRYVLSNNGASLVNYELRRKMRKVGVSLQYVSTQLCWQVFVENPAHRMGIAKLVHLDQPADLSSIQPPTAPPPLTSQQTPFTAPFPFEGAGGDAGAMTADSGASYTGGDVDTIFGPMNSSGIVTKQTYMPPPPVASYVLQEVTRERYTATDPSRHPTVQESYSIHPDGLKFDIHLRQVNFDSSPGIDFSLTLTWVPSEALKKQQQDTYNQQMAQFKWSEAQAVHAAYVNAKRDAIKLMGQVVKRPSDDLREEERSVIYGRLISKLMPALDDSESNVDITPVTSEMIRMIFDVDNMLYFVSEDWWRPQKWRATAHASRSSGATHPAATHPAATHPAATHHQGAHPAATHHQGAPEADPYLAPVAQGAEHFTSDDFAGWNGTKRHHAPSDYLITEDSTPAPFGASLGWLLQLDGDDRRNAFLNAPWVKAVIPVRPGLETAALNWLVKDHVEGSDGLDAMYVGTELDLQGKTIGQAIGVLAGQVNTTKAVTDDSIASQAVYEDGFSPLAGGFDVTKPGGFIDQWIEVLPTDQVVAVEYTPPSR